MKLEPGLVIAGTLRLVRRIAEGGMGSVWVADHLVLDTRVAVKFMSQQWGSMPSAHTRFLREARMTARIDSPHVVRVLDCRLTEADEPYLVLELLVGEDLERRVRVQGALSLFEVVEITAQACEALAASHHAGIVHRDLKPENLFLVAGAGTFVKVLDFGVAKPSRRDDCVDADLLPAGTPQYMSPEHMFDPETTDERSDLFSLGAVAYFALTGRSPFEADSLEGLYFAIDGAAFPRPSALRPELVPALDAWFEKALAKEPAARFQDARSMVQALYDATRETAGERPTLPAGPPLAETETLTLPLRRRPRGLAALLALAIVAWLFAHCGGVENAIASPETELEAGATPTVPGEAVLLPGAAGADGTSELGAPDPEEPSLPP